MPSTGSRLIGLYEVAILEGYIEKVIGIWFIELNYLLFEQWEFENTVEDETKILLRSLREMYHPVDWFCRY